MKEAEEVVRSVREKGWNGFAVTGTFHPAISANAWTLSIRL
jgi:phosphoserine phosphatase